MEAISLKKAAIEAALAGDWQAAVEANLRILEQEPEAIDSLNRLGRAYFELGKKAEARRVWRKVLSLDHYNPIAKRNLARLATPVKTPPAKPKSAAREIFLEEPGKTKTVNLVKVAEPGVLADLDSGDEVTLRQGKKGISFYSSEKVYLGALPETLTARLAPLMLGGNRYQAFVKSVSRENLEIFIREVHRTARFANHPSFSTSDREYLISAPPGTIQEEELEIAPTGEEEEEERS